MTSTIFADDASVVPQFTEAELELGLAGCGGIGIPATEENVNSILRWLSNINWDGIPFEDLTGHTGKDFPATVTTIASDGDVLYLRRGDRVYKIDAADWFGLQLSEGCFDLPTLDTSASSIFSVAYAIDDSGCGRLYQYTDSSRRLGVWNISTSHEPDFNEFFPLTPDAVNHNVAHYTRQQLLIDAIADPVVGGSTIDQARLVNTLLCETDFVNFATTGPYEFKFTGGVRYDPALAGISQILVTMDDGTDERVIVSATQGSYWSLGQFTSFESDIGAMDIEVIQAGSYKFRAYVVAADPGKPAAQMRVAAVTTPTGAISTSGNLSISLSTG